MDSSPKLFCTIDYHTRNNYCIYLCVLMNWKENILNNFEHFNGIPDIFEEFFVFNKIKKFIQIGTTWGWVIHNRIVIFGRTMHFKLCISDINNITLIWWGLLDFWGWVLPSCPSSFQNPLMSYSKSKHLFNGHNCLVLLTKATQTIGDNDI